MVTVVEIGRGAVRYLALVICGIVLASPARSWGYAEDIGKDTEQGHSTFHYELTRVLARATGFGAEDADAIGIACAATDTGSFKGDLDTSPRINIEGTQRISESGQYYHFPRRNEMNATGEYTYTGGRNECAYYTERNFCPVPTELDEIELWAVYDQATPTFGVPQSAVNDGPTAPVEPKSLVALGIYLHALADSYSHEACMKNAQVRIHLPEPMECTGVFWHEQAEFGVVGNIDGVPYTKEAGRAMWAALRWFRQKTGRADAPLLSDEAVEALVDQWSELDAAEDRRVLATARFDELNAAPTPTVTYEPTSTATVEPTATPTAVFSATPPPHPPTLTRTAVPTATPVPPTPTSTPAPGGGGGGCAIGARGADCWPAILALLALAGVLARRRFTGCSGPPASGREHSAR